MFRSILNICIFIICFSIVCNKIETCFAEIKYFSHNINNDINKKFSFFLLNGNDYSLFVEIPSKKIFKNNHNFKYQISIKSQHDLNNERFLFLKYSLCKQKCPDSLFRNNLSIGYGYSIFSGPVFLSQIQFAPNFYYVRYHNNYFFKSLIYASGMYSYCLMQNIHYCQYLTGLSNFTHISTKLENALSYFIKNNTIVLKCSHNVVFNENKFCHFLPNINKYISVSLIYCF